MRDYRVFVASDGWIDTYRAARFLADGDAVLQLELPEHLQRGLQAKEEAQRSLEAIHGVIATLAADLTSATRNEDLSERAVENAATELLLQKAATIAERAIAFQRQVWHCQDTLAGLNRMWIKQGGQMGPLRLPPSIQSALKLDRVPMPLDQPRRETEGWERWYRALLQDPDAQYQSST